MSLRILIPQILTPETVTPFGSEISASMSETNLLTDRLSQFFRTTNNLPANSIFGAYVPDGGTIKANGFGLLGMNTLPNSGEVLCVLGTSAFDFTGYPKYTPTSIGSSSGITGGVGLVQEGFGADDGLYIVMPANSYASFEFDTPGTLRTGAKRQAFWIKVAAASLPSAGNAPQMTIKLYENGTLKATSGAKLVNSTTATWIFFSWDAALLGTIDGSLVQMRLYVGDQTVAVNLHSLAWEVEDFAFAGNAYYIGDSGWSTLPVGPTHNLGVDYLPAEYGFNRRWSTKFSSIQTFSKVYFYIREDFTPGETTALITTFDTRVKPTYHDIGRMVAGLWWEPTMPRAYGEYVAINDPSIKNLDYSGGQFGARFRPRSDLKVTLDWLTVNEAAYLMDRLLVRRGILAPVWVELEPDSTTDIYAGGWMTLKSARNIAVRQSPIRSKDYPRSMELLFEESR